MWISRKEYNELKDMVRLCRELTNQFYEVLGRHSGQLSLLLDHLGLVEVEEPAKPSKKVFITKAEHKKRMAKNQKENEAINSNMIRQQMAMQQQQSCGGSIYSSWQRGY